MLWFFLSINNRIFIFLERRGRNKWGRKEEEKRANQKAKTEGTDDVLTNRNRREFKISEMTDKHTGDEVNTELTDNGKRYWSTNNP